MTFEDYIVYNVIEFKVYYSRTLSISTLWAHFEWINNIVFVCKKHYLDGLIKELVTDNSGTHTYTFVHGVEILENRQSVHHRGRNWFALPVLDDKFTWTTIY